MRVPITREQYEEMKENPNPYIKLDMECSYFMDVLKEAMDKVPRRAPKNRRSPLTQYKLSQRAGKIVLDTHERRLAHDFVMGLDYPMAGGEIGEKLAHGLSATRAMGSYYVSRLIEDKVLVEA
jgi:hypothetical protein